MKYPGTILLLCSLICFSSLKAQKAWTLEECINYAHANNLSIKSTEYQADIAENDLFQAKMNILPDLNAGAGRYFKSGHNISETSSEVVSDNYYYDSYYISSGMNLFSGLKILNNIRANKYNALSKVQDVEKEKIEITFELASAYLKILFNKELVDVAKSQRDIAAQQVNRTDKLVIAGSAARGDLLEMKAQLAAEELSVIDAQNDLDLAYLNLTQILDLDSVAGFDIVFPDTVNPDFSVPIVDVPTVYNEGLEYLPHIKSAEYALMSNERYLAYNRGRLSPTISLSANIGSGYESDYDMSYNDQLELFESRTVYIGISIPLFNNWSVKNDISNSKIEVLDARNTLDLTKQQLYKEIQQAHSDAVSAKKKYASAEEAVNSYRESFTYTQQKYEVGMVNSVEFNVAKNNLIAAESDLLQAKYEYIFSIKILDFYRGIPLTL